tara:strand:- start:335 stop:1741 length:1407 start_codon:yes stop_codon:yes gene_type:complete
MSENSLNYAGEFNIDVCTIHTVTGTAINLKDQFASVNIYESIFNNNITGDLSFIDTNDLVTNLPIIGQEKLLLKLATPNVNGKDRNVTIDYTETPLYINKVNIVTNYNENTKIVVISFSTPEMLTNNRVRVAQKFEGEPAVDMVQNILRDETLLNSKKEFYYEKTSNNFKMIAMNQRPFDFINKLSQRCLSSKYNYSPTFLFYETTKGFHFRTLDSMFDRVNVRMGYQEMTPNLKETNSIENMYNLLNYEFFSAPDILKSTRNGMYSSKLLLLDLHNKVSKTYDYNYLDDFNNHLHTDSRNQYSDNKPILSSATDDMGKRISDNYDSVFHLQTIDRNVVDGLFNANHVEEDASFIYNYNGTDQWLQKRKSKMAAVKTSFGAKITVPGNSTIQSGDLIHLQINNKSENTDPYMTGRYLATTMKHSFVRGDGVHKYTQIIECRKDSLASELPSSGVAYLDEGNTINKEIE